MSTKSIDDCGGGIVDVDNLGRGTHAAQVSNLTAHAGDYKNPIDAQTLSEVTTKYDTRGRISARTVWLTPLGTVDPNNVPIYTGPPVNDSANLPAAPYGLTTTYAYDDDLDDNTGLDATFSAHLAGLSLGTDSDGSAVLTTNPAGERILAIRDGLGRGVRSVQLNGSNSALTSNTNTFDTVVTIGGYGDVLETASANALGHTNKSHTDGAGRAIQSLDATSAITAFTYDAGGRRLSVRDPNNVGQDCTYDALGRDLTCTDTAGAVTSRTYDLAGNVKTQTDAKGKLTSLVYDSRGRQTSLTDRINATTAWTFDAAGNELSMTDAENQTTVYTYDNSGRRITTQWPDHVAGQNPGDAHYGIEAVTYDAANRPFRKTNQLGDTITTTYDLAGRMFSREYRTLANSPSGATSSVDTFTYDAASRLLAATSGQYANTVGRTYSNGKLASESLTTDGQTYATSLAYDFSVPKVTLTYPNGMTVSRSLNSRGLLNSVNMGSTTLLSRTYDAGRRLTSQTFGNGIVEAMSYRTDNLPDTRQTPVGNFSFGWDANKNKTSETITGTLSGYGWTTGSTGFDDQNRLVARNQGTGGTQLNEAYALTPVGDMTSTTTNGVAQARTHGLAHELLSIGAAAVTEDSRGNIITDGFGQTFAWDNLGHMASADTDSNGTADVTYAYDALRRRVKKTTSGEGGEAMVFVSLGHDLLADYLAGSVAASPQRNYAYTGRIDEPVAMIDYTTAGSLGAGIVEPFYYHIDANWHVRGMTNSTGITIEAYAYSSYGTPTILDPTNGTVRTTSLVGNRWMFTAREWDKETQTYHFRLRPFSAKMNRFISRDPLDYPDGANTYGAWFVPSFVDFYGLDAAQDENDAYDGLGLDTFIDNSLNFWSDWLGLATNDRTPIDDECKKKLKCIIRAILWVESRHGTGTGNNPGGDPMQVGNPADPAWPTIIGNGADPRPVRRGSLPGIEWDDLPGSIANADDLPDGIDPTVLPPKGHKDPSFDKNMSVFWGMLWYFQKANQWPGNDGPKAAWNCGKKCDWDYVIGGAGRYNGGGDPQYTTKIKNALKLSGCME